MRTTIALVYGVMLLFLLRHGELIAEPIPSPGSNKGLPVISSELPPLVSFGNKVTLDALQHDFDVFSWQSFIALSWPANADGNPNNNRQIGAGGAGSNTVWQHYKESRDIFLESGKKPPGWEVTNPPPAVCTGAGQQRVLSQVGKTPNTLDESGEPFQTGPLIDQDGAYARFEILTNEVMFDYIVKHNLYSKSGQSEFPRAADFPFSSATTVGAIMLKAA